MQGLGCRISEQALWKWNKPFFDFRQLQEMSARNEIDWKLQSLTSSLDTRVALSTSLSNSKSQQVDGQTLHPRLAPLWLFPRIPLWHIQPGCSIMIARTLLSRLVLGMRLLRQGADGNTKRHGSYCIVFVPLPKTYDAVEASLQQLYGEKSRFWGLGEDCLNVSEAYF